ncbi:universal stress protein [Streptomyces sp. NBC_01089]|uniref:universal stress protein n=1 Tax=Streptomyces sp. NBC_01089 TaxID=2903747 RepID=UPI00386EFD17|nr:universal stress protein [Streptomyces sp. NBC_01089]
MNTPVTVGFDGSPEAEAAVDWAAQEAVHRKRPLRIVYAWEWQPYRLTLMDARTERHWIRHVPHQAASALAGRYPGLEVTAEVLGGAPVPTLLSESNGSELLILGSRALSAWHGFVIGSVAQSIVAHSTGPVALVRASAGPGDAAAGAATGPAPEPAGREVVLGVDLDNPSDDLMSFSFATAARRGAPLHVVHGWKALAPILPDTAHLGREHKEHLVEKEKERLGEALRPWAEKYPDVTVREDSHAGSTADHLVNCSRGAQLLLVGRRAPGLHLGARIGHVTHAAMHHSAAPVIVVPHNE